MSRPSRKRKAKTQLLLNCRCGAKYDPTVRWITGHYDKGTSLLFTPFGRIAAGCCPVCRRMPVRIERVAFPSRQCM